MRPADLANALQDLPDARRNEVAAALDDERLADVLEELPEHDQVEILAALDRERAADVLEEMDPDDAADLLAELPKPEQEVLLDLMEPDEAAPVRQLLDYPPGTAGSVMTSEPVILHAGRDGRRGAGPDPRAAAVARRSPRRCSWPGRRWPPRPGATWAWCTSSGCCASRRRDLLGGVVDNDIDPLRPGDRRWPRSPGGWRRTTWSAMPVVDATDRLVGAVTVDDVLDHLLPRDWRDRDAEPTRRPGIPTGDAGAAPMTEPRRRPARPAARARPACALPRFDPEAFGRWSESIARFMGTAQVPRLHDRGRSLLWFAWNTLAPADLRFDPYTFTFLTLILSLQASYAAPLILLAQNRQADRDRLAHGGGPPPGRDAEGRHRVPGPGDRRAADRARRGGHPRLPPLRAGPAGRRAGRGRAPAASGAQARAGTWRSARTSDDDAPTSPPTGTATSPHVGPTSGVPRCPTGARRVQSTRRSMGGMSAPATHLEDAIQAALATVDDPEIRRPITELGMVAVRRRRRRRRRRGRAAAHRRRLPAEGQAHNGHHRRGRRGARASPASRSTSA